MARDDLEWSWKQVIRLRGEMTVVECARIDWTITADGLLTLAAGAAAFCAVLYQTRRADDGLRRQIEEARRTANNQKLDTQQSTATAILSEIDWFYRFQLATSLASLRRFDPQKGLRMLPGFRFDPFPVFSGATAHIENLPFEMWTIILAFYGPARDCANRLMEYTDYYERAALGDSNAVGLASAQIENVKNHCEGVIQVAHTACGALCHFLGREFKFPAVGVANDSDVTVESREPLRLLVQDLRPLASE